MPTLLRPPRAPAAASPTILRAVSHVCAAAVVAAQHGRRHRVRAGATDMPPVCQTRNADARVSFLVNVRHWKPRALGETTLASAVGGGVVETQGTRHRGTGEGGARSRGTLVRAKMTCGRNRLARAEQRLHAPAMGKNRKARWQTRQGPRNSISGQHTTQGHCRAEETWTGGAQIVFLDRSHSRGAPAGTPSAHLVIQYPQRAEEGEGRASDRGRGGRTSKR